MKDERHGARRRREAAAILASVFLLLAAFFWGAGTGSVHFSPPQIFAALFGGDGVAAKILLAVRLPRLVAAAFLGGALCVSGFLLQTFFQNPIAGPYVLGISSGAKLAVAVAMAAFSGKIGGPFWTVGAAFLGSLLSTMLVLAVSIRVRSGSSLIVCGILIGYACSAATDFLVTVMDDFGSRAMHDWSVGTFSGTSWTEVSVFVPVVLISVLVALVFSKQIGSLRLGERYAQSAGVDANFVRVLIVVLSSLLSACAAAFAGPISFVGIAVPHIFGIMSKSSRPAVLIPGCFLFGAFATVFCDTLSRIVLAPAEIGVSSVTAAVFVPVVVLMVTGRRKN